MNEEVSKESIRFCFHYGAKPTTRLLVRGLKAYLRHRKNKKLEKARGIATVGKGKQTVKQLISQNQGVSSMEISGESMRLFKKIAGKYGVDFAIVKDKTADKDNPRYTVFFKARDTDAIEAVIKNYAAEIVKKTKQKERPSTLQKLKQLKAEIAKKPKKVVEKKKEQVL